MVTRRSLPRPWLFPPKTPRGASARPPWLSETVRMDGPERAPGVASRVIKSSLGCLRSGQRQQHFVGRHLCCAEQWARRCREQFEGGTAATRNSLDLPELVPEFGQVVVNVASRRHSGARLSPGVPGCRLERSVGGEMLLNKRNIGSASGAPLKKDWVLPAGAFLSLTHT